MLKIWNAYLQQISFVWASDTTKKNIYDNGPSDNYETMLL